MKKDRESKGRYSRQGRKEKRNGEGGCQYRSLKRFAQKFERKRRSSFNSPTNPSAAPTRLRRNPIFFLATIFSNVKHDEVGCLCSSCFKSFDANPIRLPEVRIPLLSPFLFLSPAPLSSKPKTSPPSNRLQHSLPLNTCNGTLPGTRGPSSRSMGAEDARRRRGETAGIARGPVVGIGTRRRAFPLRSGEGERRSSCRRSWRGSRRRST